MSICPIKDLCFLLATCWQTCSNEWPLTDSTSPHHHANDAAIKLRFLGFVFFIIIISAATHVNHRQETFSRLSGTVKMKRKFWENSWWKLLYVGLNRWTSSSSYIRSMSRMNRHIKVIHLLIGVDFIAPLSSVLLSSHFSLKFRIINAVYVFNNTLCHYEIRQQWDIFAESFPPAKLFCSPFACDWTLS